MDDASDDTFLRNLEQHLQSRALREQAQTMEDMYKSRLKELLPGLGVEDDKGSYWVQYEDPITVADQLVESVKLERRSSVSLDPEKVLELLPEEFKASVIKYEVRFVVSSVPVESLPEELEIEQFIDEDELLALNFSGELDDDLLRDMYVETKPVWALKVGISK